MLHVCVDARLYNASGIGTFLKNILSFLREDPFFHLTTLVFLKDVERMKQHGFSSLVSMKSPIYSIQEQIELSFKIPPCDVFWAPHFNIPLGPIRTKKRLTTIHDVYHLAFPQQFSPAKRRAASFLYQHAIDRSDQVTTDSFFSLSEIQRLCKVKKKVGVIPLGIAPHLVIKDFQKKKEVHRKYRLPERFLLCLGNGKPHKNLHRLIEAFQGLEKNIALVLVGPLQGHFPSIYSIPYVEEEDLPYIYNLAEALVFPSLYEGFGLPPLEAMACECPVITSKIASLPEVCGEAAEYVDPFSISSIRNGIIKVIEDQNYKAHLIQKGKVHIQQFTWKKTMLQYKELIQGLVK